MTMLPMYVFRPPGVVSQLHVFLFHCVLKSTFALFLSPLKRSPCFCFVSLLNRAAAAEVLHRHLQGRAGRVRPGGRRMDTRRLPGTFRFDVSIKFD